MLLTAAQLCDPRILLLPLLQAGGQQQQCFSALEGRQLELWLSPRAMHAVEGGGLPTASACSTVLVVLLLLMCACLLPVPLLQIPLACGGHCWLGAGEDWAGGRGDQAHIHHAKQVLFDELCCPNVSHGS